MHEGMWHKGKGAGMLVLGLLILANVYFAVADWWTFFGALLVLAGFVKLVMPMKKHRR